MRSVPETLQRGRAAGVDHGVRRLRPRVVDAARSGGACGRAEDRGRGGECRQQCEHYTNLPLARRCLTAIHGSPSRCEPTEPSGATPCTQGQSRVPPEGPAWQWTTVRDVHVQEERTDCANCGAALAGDARFCQRCGAPVSSDGAATDVGEPVEEADQRRMDPVAPDLGAARRRDRADRADGRERASSPCSPWSSGCSSSSGRHRQRRTAPRLRSRVIWSMQTVTARMSASSWPGAISIP